MTGTATAPEPVLLTVEQALRDACGITLSEGLRTTLSDALARASREAGQSEADFLGSLRDRDPRALTALVEASVIGETYFFRHPEQFDALRDLLLLQAPPDRPLVIWSAGCATGEEAYSLSMALLDAGRASSGDRILATDVSARALAVAREGIYGEWSLRRMTPSVRARHFEERGTLVSVRAEARGPVVFDRHNLVRDPAPGGSFDLVVCRNVLIYFTADAAQEVTRRLLGAVRPGGLLLLGPVETSVAEGLEVERIERNGATLYRRVDGAVRPRVKIARAHERKAHAPRKGHAASRDRVRPRAAPVRPIPDPAPLANPAKPEPLANPAPLAPKGFDAARAAARKGELALAESLAREAAAKDLCPESYLLLSMAAEARGDVPGAVEAVRRALYLDPGLAMGHAALVPLYGQLGLADDAARARRNALEAIQGLDDGTPLRGVEPVTAGALRSALGVAQGGDR